MECCHHTCSLSILAVELIELNYVTADAVSMLLVSLSIMLYADDILLLEPSVSSLKQLWLVCEEELSWLNLTVNARKCGCVRFGLLFSIKCSYISTIDGHELIWHDEI